MKRPVQLYVSFMVLRKLLLSLPCQSVQPSSGYLKGNRSKPFILPWPQSSSSTLPTQFSTWKSRLTEEALESQSSRESERLLSSRKHGNKQQQRRNDNSEHDSLHHFSLTWEAAESHEAKHHSRLASSTAVDYGGSHPYEIMERRRQLVEENQGITHPDEMVEGRSLQSNPWDSNAEYKPIRINVDTNYLSLLSSTEGQKIQFLKEEIIPEVVNFWTSAIKVFPMNKNLKVDGSFCPFSERDQVDVGVADTDLLILLAANVKAICDNGPLAAARSCQADQYDRPIVGSAVVCLDTMDLEDINTKDTFVSILIHEIAHVLGMRSIDFSYFYDPTTGQPRTPRPLKEERVKCVDGIVSDIIKPAENTMQSGMDRRGNLYYEIVTPGVRSVARNQFNCQKMTGARLENQPTNNGNCFGTHWEGRLFASELLAAITTQTKQFLSPLTLALFEDSGWYKADFSKAEMLSFGYGRGCDFVYEDCIDEDGNVPEWGKEYFCNEMLGSTARVQCDNTLRYISRCDLVDFSDFPHAIPPQPKDQYFKDHPTWGGLLHTASYCPLPSMVVTGTNSDGIFEFDCSDTDLESNVEPEFFGESSRCYETNLARPICMETKCDFERNKVIALFKDGKEVVCENDNDWMPLPGLPDGSIFQCPSLAKICPDLICPKNCAGRGICDFESNKPACICCNPEDTTPTCENSPVGCEYELKIPTAKPTFRFNEQLNPTPTPTPLPTPSPVPASFTRQPTKSPVIQYPTFVGEVPAPAAIPTAFPTYVDVMFDDDFLNSQKQKQDNEPSSQPSLLPRDRSEVAYTFCLEHGMLLRMEQVLSETSENIKATLTELFEDDVQVMGNKWKIEEQHLRVTSIISTWIENPPAGTECSCLDEDEESTCSLIDTMVQISHWDKLEKNDVRYLLLYFAPYISKGLTFKARYFGFEASSTTSTFTMQGLPATEMSDQNKKMFEETLLNLLKENVAGTGVSSLNILNVGIEKVSPIVTNRFLNHENRILEQTGASEVVALITGEYKPPPYVNFKDVVDGIVEEESSEFVERLKESDPFFKDLKGVVVGRIPPTLAPTPIVLHEPETEESDGSSNIGMILGIIVGLLAATAAAVAGFVYIKRENGIDKDFDPDDFEREKSMYDMQTSESDEGESLSTYSGNYADRDQFDEKASFRRYDDGNSFQPSESYSLRSANASTFLSNTSTYETERFDTNTLNSDPSLNRSGRYSFTGSRQGSLRSSSDDTYTTGPTPDYSYLSRSGNSLQDSYSDQGSSFVTGLSKNSFLTESYTTDYDTISQEDGTFQTSKYGDPPSCRTSMVDPPSLDPPEEIDYDDDLGTFAGHSIHPNYTKDDVSLLPSVKGVEDTWFEDDTIADTTIADTRTSMNETDYTTADTKSSSFVSGSFSQDFTSSSCQESQSSLNTDDLGRSTSSFTDGSATNDDTTQMTYDDTTQMTRSQGSTTFQSQGHTSFRSYGTTSTCEGNNTVVVTNRTIAPIVQPRSLDTSHETTQPKGNEIVAATSPSKNVLTVDSSDEGAISRSDTINHYANENNLIEQFHESSELVLFDEKCKKVVKSDNENESQNLLEQNPEESDEALTLLFNGDKTPEESDEALTLLFNGDSCQAKLEPICENENNLGDPPEVEDRALTVIEPTSDSLVEREPSNQTSQDTAEGQIVKKSYVTVDNTNADKDKELTNNILVPQNSVDLSCLDTFTDNKSEKEPPGHSISSLPQIMATTEEEMNKSDDAMESAVSDTKENTLPQKNNTKEPTVAQDGPDSIPHGDEIGMKNITEEPSVASIAQDGPDSIPHEDEIGMKNITEEPSVASIAQDGPDSIPHGDEIGMRNMESIDRDTQSSLIEDPNETGSLDLEDLLQSDDEDDMKSDQSEYHDSGGVDGTNRSVMSID